MTLLLAQPETSIYPDLCHAINRWLWRWSPWHLRHDQALDRKTLTSIARRNGVLEGQVRDMEKWVKEYSPLPIIPLPKENSMSVAGGLAYNATRFTITSKQYTFMATCHDLMFRAGSLEHIRTLMIDEYVHGMRKLLHEDFKGFATC